MIVEAVARLLFHWGAYEDLFDEFKVRVRYDESTGHIHELLEDLGGSIWHGEGSTIVIHLESFFRLHVGVSAEEMIADQGSTEDERDQAPGYFLISAAGLTKRVQCYYGEDVPKEKRFIVRGGAITVEWDYAWH